MPAAPTAASTRTPVRFAAARFHPLPAPPHRGGGPIAADPWPGLARAVVAAITVIAASGCGSSSKTALSPSPVKCQVALSSPSAALEASGATGVVSVSTQPECAWTASPAAPWIVGLSPATGQGNGEIEFRAAANPMPASRQGEIEVNGARVALRQDAAPCVFDVSPLLHEIDSGGGESTVAVSTIAGCTWTAASDAAWLTIASEPSGNASGIVRFRAQANAGAAREARLRVANAEARITQRGVDPCAFVLDPVGQSISAAGGSGRVQISAGAGCSWTATSQASWITITSPSSGAGNDAVTFAVAANAGPARIGMLSIGGGTFVVTQSAAGAVACTYALSSTSYAADASGSHGGPVRVSTAPGCPWAAMTSVPWVTVTAGVSGLGAGDVTFTVAPNSGDARNTTLAIAGHAFAIAQSAASPRPSCVLTVSPRAHTVPVDGGVATIAVATANGCGWNATSSASWVSVASGSNGNGNGTVSLSVAANTGGARTATVSIGDQSVTVAQDGGTTRCDYSIAPTSYDAAPGGATSSVAIAATSGCIWTATSSASWITITGGASGAGNGTTSFSVAPNGGAARTGTLTIADQSVVVSQRAQTPSCSFNVTPSSQSAPAAGGSGTFTVTTASGCAWTASSQTGWLSLTGGASGSGSGSVTFAAAPNSGAARAGTLTIAGVAVTVSQAAAPVSCTYAVAPLSQSFTLAGGLGNATVTTPDTCQWTATSGTPWITVLSGASGNGNGPVSFAVAANVGNARTGTLSIAGETFTVSQAGVVPCTYSIAPTSQSIGAAGGAGSAVTVSTAAGCAWTATSNATWISVTAGASGSGDGSTSFSVAANTGDARSGTLTIAGRTFTVSQAGAPPPCSYAISPSSQSIPLLGGSGTISVTAGAGCTWTATSNAAWISVTSGANGAGNGAVNFSVALNLITPRSGTITVAGHTFTVNQAGLLGTESGSAMAAGTARGRR
jgi:hypothetical protein